jgi:hypothetical protein
MATLVYGHLRDSFHGLYFRNVKYHESRFGKHNPKPLNMVYGSCTHPMSRIFLGPTLVLRGSHVDGDLHRGLRQSHWI